MTGGNDGDPGPGFGARVDTRDKTRNIRDRECRRGARQDGTLAPFAFPSVCLYYWTFIMATLRQRTPSLACELISKGKTNYIGSCTCLSPISKENIRTFCFMFSRFYLLTSLNLNFT